MGSKLLRNFGKSLTLVVASASLWGATRQQLNQGLDQSTTLIQTSSAAATSAVNRMSALKALSGTSKGSVISLGFGKGTKGTDIPLTVLLAKGIGSPSTLQFDVQLSSGITFKSIANGKSSTDAGKSASANVIGSSLRVLIFGLNQNIIQDGPLATITLHFDTVVSSGPQALPIVGFVVSDPNGVSVPTFGVSGVVVIS